MLLTKKQRESLTALPIKEPQPTHDGYQIYAYAKKKKFEGKFILEIDYFRNNEFYCREFYFDLNNYYQQDSIAEPKLKKGTTPVPLRKDCYYYTPKADDTTIQTVKRYFKIGYNPTQKTLYFFRQHLSTNRCTVRAVKGCGISMEAIDMLPLPEGLAERAKYIKENLDLVAIMQKKSHHRYPCTCKACGEKFYAYREYEWGYSVSAKKPTITIPDWNTKTTHFCPNCGKEIMLIYFNANDYRVNYAENISIFQKIGDALILRIFHINRDDEATLTECNRFIMTPTANKHWRVTYSYDWYNKRYYNPTWEQYSKTSIWNLDIGYLFEPSIQALKFTRFDVPFIMDKLAKAKKKRDFYSVMELLSRVKPKNKYIMLLYQKGYTELADEFAAGARPIGMNCKGRTASEVLGADASYWAKFGNIAEMTYNQWRVQSFLKTQPDAVKVYNQIKEIGISRYSKGSDPLRSSLDVDKIIEVLKIGHPQRTVNYLIKQNISFQDYLDLIEQYKRLNFNITENLLYPKSYKQTHDELNDLENKIREEKELEAAKAKDAKFLKAIKKWLKMNFEDGGLSIEVIRTASELKREAIQMHNCSAGYIDRIIQGSCVIFKIRRTEEPDQAFYMLELSRDRRIIQCRGIRNSSSTPEVDAFLEKWKTAKFKKTEAA